MTTNGVVGVWERGREQLTNIPTGWYVKVKEMLIWSVVVRSAPGHPGILAEAGARRGGRDPVDGREV